MPPVRVFPSSVNGASELLPSPLDDELLHEVSKARDAKTVPSNNVFIVLSRFEDSQIWELIRIVRDIS